MISERDCVRAMGSFCVNAVEQLPQVLSIEMQSFFVEALLDLTLGNARALHNDSRIFAL